MFCTNSPLIYILTMFCTNSNLCVNLNSKIIEVTTIYIYKLLGCVQWQLICMATANVSIQPHVACNLPPAALNSLWPSTSRSILYYKWLWFDPNSLLWSVLLLCGNLCNNLLSFSGNLYKLTCCGDNFMCRIFFILCQLYVYEYMLALLTVTYMLYVRQLMCIADYTFATTFFYNNL